MNKIKFIEMSKFFIISFVVTLGVFVMYAVVEMFFKGVRADIFNILLSTCGLIVFVSFSVSVIITLIKWLNYDSRATLDKNYYQYCIFGIQISLVLLLLDALSMGIVSASEEHVVSNLFVGMISGVISCMIIKMFHIRDEDIEDGKEVEKEILIVEIEERLEKLKRLP